MLNLELLPASWLLMLFSFKAAAQVAQKMLAWIGLHDTFHTTSYSTPSTSWSLPSLYAADTDKERVLRF